MKKNSQGAKRLGLTKQNRIEVWNAVQEIIENYYENLENLSIIPDLDPGKIRDALKSFDFEKEHEPLEALEWAAQGLSRDLMHWPHPRCFGHFCPASSAMGVAADALVAAFNPQLATYRAAPFAVEVEQHLIKQWGQLFGYPKDKVFGHFTTGGTEANHTALLCALGNRFPEFYEKGIIGLSSRPALYVSTESHLCHLRNARLTGIGCDFVRKIPSGTNGGMSPQALRESISRDKEGGLTPLMVIGTIGTTNAGIIDPIRELVKIAQEEGLWFHLDAAYGGAAVLLPELKQFFLGCEFTDSITLDAHKWLSVPMGAGIFMTQRRGILESVFRFESAFIKLKHTSGLDVVDYHYQSMQWSRRFIGLKLFLTLAVAGWEGYREMIREQVELGNLLRHELEKNGWKVLNQTPFPIVCFVDATDPRGSEELYLEEITKAVVHSKEAWLFCTHLDSHTSAIRVGVVSYWTRPEDVIALIKSLEKARQEVKNLKT